MQTHIRNNRETARPMQLWVPLSIQQKGPVFSEGYPHPGRWVALPLGCLFRCLSRQSKVRAGGLTLASGLTFGPPGRVERSTMPVEWQGGPTARGSAGPILRACSRLGR